jgi:hypothetical protein
MRVRTILAALCLAAAATPTPADDRKPNAAADAARACNACVRSCDACANRCQELIAAGESQARALRAFAACRECVRLSSAATAMIPRRDPNLDATLTACADACTRCAALCESFKNDAAMSRCAADCRACADACRVLLRETAGKSKSE